MLPFTFSFGLVEYPSDDTSGDSGEDAQFQGEAKDEGVELQRARDTCSASGEEDSDDDWEEGDGEWEKEEKELQTARDDDTEGEDSDDDWGKDKGEEKAKKEEEGKERVTERENRHRFQAHFINLIVILSPF